MLTSKLRKKNEDFIKKANEIWNNYYDYSLTDYTNAHNKIIIICPEHGQFDIAAYVHVASKNPQGCKKCGLKRRKYPGQKSNETFIKQAQDKWGDKYNYSNTKYINKVTKIKYICKEHGEIEQFPKLHLQSGCPFCNGRGISKYDKESFVAKAIEVHGDRYDYSKVIISSISDKIVIICNIHGDFTQRASNHINKNGCPKCMGGVSFNTDEYIKKAQEKHDNKFDYSKTEYSRSHEKIIIICPKHGEFTQMAYMHLNSEYSCPYCVAELTSSLKEKEITSFIKEYYNEEIINNDRKTFGYKEIDILIPKLNLGIEFNGNYWHTEAIVGKNYHFNKANIAEQKNIRLIQIFEHEWNNKQDIIKSRLLSAIGVNERIYARNTKIIEMDTKQKNNFLDRTHIQGKDNSSISLGLIINDKIIACMTFGKPRYEKKYDYELIRYSSELNTNIIGGASKLFNSFKNKYKGTVITYADRCWGNGEVYKNLGFIKNGITSPGYFYYNLNKKTIHHRLEFQKKLLKKMSFYDENLSEYEIMKVNGYERIWNAGNVKWLYDLCAE